MRACSLCERDICQRCRGGSCACCGEVSNEKEDLMLRTQKATSAFDLPHPYKQAGPDTQYCVCGRDAWNRLHDISPISEQAAHSQRSAPLQTEKGTPV